MTTSTAGFGTKEPELPTRELKMQHERDDAVRSLTVVRGQRDEALADCERLTKERDEAMKRAASAEKYAVDSADIRTLSKRDRAKARIQLYKVSFNMLVGLAERIVSESLSTPDLSRGYGAIMAALKEPTDEDIRDAKGEDNASSAESGVLLEEARKVIRMLDVAVAHMSPTGVIGSNAERVSTARDVLADAVRRADR